MRRRLPKRALEKLLLQTRQLKEQLEVFKQSAQAVAGPLDKSLSHAEVQAMVTARANILGTLECLLYQDLGDLLRQLDELDGHLTKACPATVRKDRQGSLDRPEVIGSPGPPWNERPILLPSVKDSMTVEEANR